MGPGNWSDILIIENQNYRTSYQENASLITFSASGLIIRS